jgi:hypothetical protein
MERTQSVSGRSLLLAGIAAAVLAPSIASAQLASALLREDDELLPGEEISSLSNTAVNHVGGYACSLNTSGTGTVSRIWGNPDGGPGMLLRSEMTIGDLQQVSFESFYGMGDMGELAYGTTSTNTVSGETGLDGVWLDDLPVLHELDPVPTLPGQFSTFNSRPTSSGAGGIYWVGGITASQGSSTQNRCLFSGLGATVEIMGGDFLPGIDEPIKTGSSNIDFDFRVSRFETNWINLVQVDTSSSNDGVMVINGVPIMSGGSMMREDTPIPESVGGLPDERWDNFDFFGINDVGDFLITGDTSASSSIDEFVSFNGEIILREGTVLDLDGVPWTLDGSIEGGYMNKETDWAVIWDIEDADGENLEALLVNGEVLLVEGDPVDGNGDGVIDENDDNGLLANFTGISSLTIGPRVGGVANVYFTADIDFNGTSSSSDDLEGFFCMPVQVAPALVLPLDIKPGSCPNSFNRNGNGVLPVALVGTEMIDVTGVDLGSLLLSRADGVGGSVAPLEGPPGPHTVFEDVATPFFGEMCECDDAHGDGFMDVSMKFRSQDVVDALELDGLLPGDLVELVLTGALLDGTPFEASDCVRLVPPGTSGGFLHVTANAPDVFISLTPLDDQLDGGGFGSFERTYPVGTVVTLTAPAVHGVHTFVGWHLDGPGLTARDVPLDLRRTIQLTVTDDGQLAQPIYRTTKTTLRLSGRH